MQNPENTRNRPEFFGFLEKPEILLSETKARPEPKNSGSGFFLGFSGFEDYGPRDNFAHSHMCVRVRPKSSHINNLEIGRGLSPFITKFTKMCSLGNKFIQKLQSEPFKTKAFFFIDEKDFELYKLNITIDILFFI